MTTLLLLLLLLLGHRPLPPAPPAAHRQDTQTEHVAAPTSPLTTTPRAPPTRLRFARKGVVFAAHQANRVESRSNLATNDQFV